MGVFTRSEVARESERTASGRVRAVAAAVGLTVGALLVSLVGGVAFAVPVLLFGLDVGSAPVFLALTVAGQLGFLVAGYAYARFAGVRVRVAVPDGRDLGYAAAGTVGALAVAVVASGVLATLDLVPDSVLGEVVTANPAILVGLAVLSVFVIAPAEEFLFRGVVQGRLRRSFGPVGAVLGATLLFGSLHLGNYVGAFEPVVAGALLIAGVGSVFGALYERTRNLTVPVLAHGAYNVVLFALAYVAI